MMSRLSYHTGDVPLEADAAGIDGTENLHLKLEVTDHMYCSDKLKIRKTYRGSIFLWNDYGNEVRSYFICEVWSSIPLISNLFFRLTVNTA